MLTSTSTTSSSTETPFVIVASLGDANPNTPNNGYEYIEITIFATVITLCFCTVFVFLVYISFKRKVNEARKKRHGQHVAYSSQSSAAADQSHTEDRSEHSRSRSSRKSKKQHTPSVDANTFLRTPTTQYYHQAIASDNSSKYFSSHSGSAISIMRRDQIRTPATSPVQPR